MGLSKHKTDSDRKGALALTSGLDQLAAGQATYGMANLCPERTGLPFIVFISQRDDARHAVRVKVSPSPRVKVDDMGSYAVSPFAHKAGHRLPADHERGLERWITLNRDVIERYWDGDIEYTEDALACIRPI